MQASSSRSYISLAPSSCLGGNSALLFRVSISTWIHTLGHSGGPALSPPQPRVSIAFIRSNRPSWANPVKSLLNTFHFLFAVWFDSSSARDLICIKQPLRLFLVLRLGEEVIMIARPERLGSFSSLPSLDLSITVWSPFCNSRKQKDISLCRCGDWWGGDGDWMLGIVVW